MNHISLIQAFIDANKFKTYLEISGLKSLTFENIKIKSKIAIDPEVMVVKQKQSNGKYFDMTSDEFFASHSKVLNGGLDIAFIDGLHTKDQVAKDVTNCLKYLSKGGVIILHDTNPTSPSMAYDAECARDAMSAGLEGWTGEWCGDVWKQVVFLRHADDKLNIFTCDFDYGCTVITVGQPENMLQYPTDEINEYEYIDLEANRKVLLNLKSENEVQNILEDRFNIKTKIK